MRRPPPAREKLIRDRIPALAAAQGRRLSLRTAEPTEMARLLGLKLVEEMHEVLGAIGTGRTPEVLDELADLQTFIDEFAAPDVDESGARAHGGKGLGAEESASIGRVR